MFAVGVTIAHFTEWSVSAETTTAIVSLGTMLSAISGWREFRIEARIDQMREFGRLAGSIGRPPDFYKKSATDPDVADEIAIMQGWDRGWQEFQTLPKEQQDMYTGLNLRDGYLSDGDRK